MMQNRLYTFVLIAVLPVILQSCNFNDEKTSEPDLTGTYSGTFTVEYQNGEVLSNPVTVSFMEDNTYQSSGNANYIPAGGSGTYEVDDSQIIFKDTNYWTANFDWNLILDGEYDYSLTGNQLILTAQKNGEALYRYELTKEWWVAVAHGW